MKPNWSLIACSVLFVAAVFGVAVLDGFNNVAQPEGQVSIYNAGSDAQG